MIKNINRQTLDILIFDSGAGALAMKAALQGTIGPQHSDFRIECAAYDVLQPRAVIIACNTASLCVGRSLASLLPVSLQQSWRCMT